MSVSPISPTAVLHAKLVPAVDFGATLAFAVAIRGPSGWYNQQTNMHRIPADSVPVGVDAEVWRVGDRQYDIRYDSARTTLTVLGRSFDLRKGRLVLVTLGATPSDSAIVLQAQLQGYRHPRPEPFPPRFLSAVPELRVFAGLAQ